MLHSSTSARLRLLCCCTGGDGMCCEPLPGCSHIQMSVGTCSRFCLRRRVSSSAFVMQGNKTCFVVFFYFNSCSVGGESSLMCKKYVIELPQKSPPFAAFASWTLFGKNMRLWTLTLCDITEGTGMSRRSVATPPVRPPETLCV